MSLFLPTPYDQAVKPLDFTPAKDPYAGSGGLFLASAEEAFTLNITTSALRYANYWYQGLTGRQLDQAEFDAEVEQAGLRGFIEFKEDMTAEQLQATIKYVKAQQKRWAIQRGSSNGLMDSVLGLGASFLGSMVDPVELALMFTPGLQVGNAMRKSTMQAALKMPMARIKQIQRNAPNVYRKLLVENPAALGSATLKGALTRGALIGEAEAVIREPMLYGFNNAMQVEYTPVDSLMNLTVAPMLSGLIHGMGHKLNKHWTQPNMAKALTDQEFPETDIFLLNELNNSAEDFFRRMDYMEGRIRGEEQTRGKPFTEAERGEWVEQYFNLVLNRNANKFATEDLAGRTFVDEVVDQMRSWASFEERGNVIVGHSRAIPDPKAEVGEFTPGMVFARDTGRPMGPVNPELNLGNPYTAAQQRANYRLSYQRLMNNSRPHINGEEAALSKIFKLAFGSEIRFLDRAAAERMGIQGTTVARMAGTLFITATDRPTMMYVAGHEFSHSLKWRNPDLYFKFVSSVLSNPDSEKIVLNAMKRTLAEQNPSEVKALPQGKQLEEAFGNVMGELMNNKDFWRALGQNMEPSAWNSLKKELVSFFREFIESIREVIEHLGFRDSRYAAPDPQPKYKKRIAKKADLFNGVSADNLQALAREVGEILETLDPKANYLRELLDEFGPDPKRKTRTAMARMDRLFGKQLAEMADERFDLRGLFADVAEWEAEMNALVFSFENESAAVALMGGTGFGKSPLMPKEKIYGSVEQYAVSFASLHDPVYAEGYATYLIHKAKLDSEIQLHTEAAKKVQVEIKKNNTLAEKYQKDKNWPAWQRAKARNDDYLKTLKFHTENKHKLQFAKRDLAGDWVKRLNISVTEREDGIIVRWRRPDPGTKMVEQTFVEGQPREHFASGGVQAIQRWNPDANRYEVIMINPEEGRPLTNEEVAEEMNFVFKEDPEYWNYGDYHTQTDKGLNMTDSQLYKATNMSRSSGDPAKDIEFVRGVWDWQTGKYERPELSKTPLSESALPEDFTLKGKPKSRMPARTTVQSYPWNPGGVYETGNHAAEGIDRMTSRHILGLDSEGRSFIERTGRKAQSVLKRGMDRLSARLHPSQQEIEPILRRVQNEAQLLQGYKADRTVKEILDSLDENLWNQVELESRFIWEATPSQAAEAAVPVTPAMSVQDRALLSELNKLNRNQFNEWKAMNMLAKANQHKKSLNQFLEDILRIKSYQTWSESQLIDFYQRIRNNEVDNFRRREAGEATVSLKTELYNEARQMMLSAVRNEQARRSWVDGAKKQKNQKLWLLSQLDGLFRKGLSPEDTGAPITSRMAARRTKEIMPLVYVLGRYNVWDEFTARNSDLARRVFAYIETGDQKYIGKRPEIREIGEVIKALNKQQVFGLKQNGARLTHREDYTISARHNGAQIRKVGFEEWAEYIFPLLDWDKTFDRLGYSLKPEERSKKVAMGYLQRVYEDIVNNRFREMDNPVDELLINYNSEVSQRRTLIFNPGKLFDYDNQYGSGAPAHALLEQIQRRSDLSELTGIFGPNPKETWSKIKNSLGLEEKGELGIDHMNALVRFFIGEMDYPHNKKWSDLGQMARSFTNTALLGNAGISAVVDVAQSMDTLKYLGVDLGSWNREYLKALRRSWKRQKSPYQMMFRAQAAGLDSILGAGSRRILGEVAGYGRVRELNDLMFRVNGLNMWTTIAQEAMVDILNRNLPTLVNDKFFQGVLRRYGIDEADLSLMRRMAQKVEDIDGPVLKLTPDMLDVRSPQTAQKLRVMMDDFMRQAILEPDATSQIFGRGWAQAGTAWGETIRTVTQYMPFGLAIYQKTYRRMLNGYGEQGLGAVMGDPSNRRLLNMMSFVAWSMSLGYLTMNLKELAKGREPNYILNLDGLKVRKWIFQSGVMGPLADILWVRDKSDIPEMAVGPFFGMVSELGGEVLDLDTRGFLMDLERNSPFATLPVAGELRKNIFRNILGDGLVEAQDRHLKLLQRD